MHKYQVGQTVLFRTPECPAPDQFVVTKLMPLRAGELEYRIKSPREEHERHPKTN
jgi:hypothetical protein